MARLRCDIKTRMRCHTPIRGTCLVTKTKLCAFLNNFQVNNTNTYQWLNKGRREKNVMISIFGPKRDPIRFR